MSCTNLTAREIFKLSNSAADLYRTTDRPALTRQIAMLANSALAIEFSGHWEIDTATMEQASTYSHSSLEDLVNRSWPIYTHYAQRYPFFAKPMNDPTNRGRVRYSEEVLPRALIEPIGFLDEYARPNHCEHQLIYYFRQPSTRLAILTCSRGRRAFSAKERKVLEFLAPHFQSAYDNSGAFEDRKAALARAKAIQETVAFECLWVDNDFKIKEATEGVPELIREFLREEFTVSALPGKLLSWLRSFLPLGTGRPLAPLSVAHESATLKIRIYPDKLPGLHLLTLSRKVTVPTLEHLKPLGLTPRETEILIWVAQAKTNDEIARLLGCSNRTVAKHMEHLLLKLKVENRSAAMLAVWPG
jgi:DNA-binding CsgD family transcriptional regulator